MTARPNANAEHRPAVLTITPGMNGYRVALVGGEIYEPIAEFPTAEEAASAWANARDAVAGFAASRARRIDTQHGDD